jgi:hypothetical protein
MMLLLKGYAGGCCRCYGGGAAAAGTAAAPPLLLLLLALRRVLLCRLREPPWGALHDGAQQPMFLRLLPVISGYPLAWPSGMAPSFPSPSR